MSITDAIRELLNEDLDVEVIDYIKGCLQEYDETESSLEDIMYAAGNSFQLLLQQRSDQ